MSTRVSDYPAVVLAAHKPPCLSIYQKTHRHHPENQQDPIRFRNLVKQLEESLRKKYPKRDVAPLMQPFYDLAENHRFWNHTLDGLAVFGAPDHFSFYRLPEPVREIVVAAETFHTKPLLRVFQTYERYQVLSLTRSEVKLYEGTKDSFDELSLAESVPHTLTEALGEEITAPHQTVASYGGTKGPAMHHGHGAKKDESAIDAERFFRLVDKGILDHHSQQSGLPLLLAALGENQGLFRQISQNPFLMNEGIDFNPDALKNGSLHEKSWAVVEPQIRSRMDALLQEYEAAQPKGMGSGDLEQVAAAAAAGKVATLFIGSDVQVPGRLDRVSGAIELDELVDPEVDDLLDDIGELVLEKGGVVRVIPSDRMPTMTGIAAIFRF
ncbi:MAG: hypothetical protein OQK66_02030 [Prosthecochloris sp.]|uniref:Uncharacterized protein n=1 Tax=Prosthecochloris aestuarii (strain DSM 271 / SK 413) TaxID=290512 RepID=B4S3B5_PROA2|nr:MULTISPECIES: hypothetical protein [Prosthecochloris]ACF45209.1 conserved hypothetical protein [Prosthecochloris aestuarii DSM 271]MCW8797728.1 hypothetical protein [Prosthecochloris sp.]NEX12537.1 hypothetical protein [Prosthecochloris sp.]